ncbi:hypothetical protein Pcinc_038888 [Petrolisthes cinctipes]|uniref:Uncharacterized protein n=1 Tax=Petrolisthes cinctipes TaxID=88211 RepID=A0AAE1BTH0_PETCI|nr:hypothetical protein Pcinc_038888 [Petrolisthes cinctipes]KAK3854650.1 hypothetical protein Pcinc_038888 [Petrolisthes cinctipes]
MWECFWYVGGEMTATFYPAPQDHYPRSPKEVDDHMKATSDWKSIKCFWYVGGEMTATFYPAPQDHYPRSLQRKLMTT